MRKQSWEHEYCKKALITQKWDILTKFWSKKLVYFVLNIGSKDFSKILSVDISRQFEQTKLTIANIWRKTSYLTQNKASYLNVDPKCFLVKFLECGLKHSGYCSRNHLQVPYLVFSVGKGNSFTRALLWDNCHCWIEMQVLLIIRGRE